MHVPADNAQGFLAVRCFYTPQLRTTVIDERDLIIAAGHKPQDIFGESILKYYEAGTFTYRATHKKVSSKDVVVHGILQNGKCYTGALIPTVTDEDIEALKQHDPVYAQACADQTATAIEIHQLQQEERYKHLLSFLPPPKDPLPIKEWVQHDTPVLAITKETERLL